MARGNLMARTPKSAAIERIETTDLYTLDYTINPNVVSTPFLVLTNLTDNILDISVYINDSEQDFLIVKNKIPQGVGKTWFVKELSLEKLNAGHKIKIQSTTDDPFNSFLSVSEVSDT